MKSWECETHAAFCRTESCCWRGILLFHYSTSDFSIIYHFTPFLHINEHKNIFFYMMKNYTNFNILVLCIEDIPPPPSCMITTFSPEPVKIRNVAKYQFLYLQRKESWPKKRSGGRRRTRFRAKTVAGDEVGMGSSTCSITIPSVLPLRWLFRLWLSC